MSANTRTLLSYLRRIAAPAASDAVLLARWIEHHNEDAFAALMARHGPMVLGICRRLLGDGPDAEDVFQAVFVVLSRQASRLRQPEALAGFLHTVAVRLARKVRKSKRRQRMRTNADMPEPIDPRPHSLDALSGRELLALIDEEMARLPEVYRLPLLLCLLLRTHGRGRGATTGLERRLRARPVDARPRAAASAVGAAGSGSVGGRRGLAGARGGTGETVGRGVASSQRAGTGRDQRRGGRDDAGVEDEDPRTDAGPSNGGRSGGRLGVAR